jgi:transposase
MYDLTTKSLSINIYNYLHNINIIGNERIKFMTDIFKFHMTTFYGWYKENNNNYDIYINNNINPLIVNDIISYVKENKDININLETLKKIINKKYNTYFNIKTIVFILKTNKIKYNTLKNTKINKDIIDFLLKSITENNVITAKEMTLLVHNKFNISISESAIYDILKKNKITYKRVTFRTNPYTEEEEKDRLEGIKYTLDNLEQDNIISYDEISITNNEHPVFGWSKSGEKCIVNNPINSIKGNRFSLGMATNNKKIIGFKIVEKGFKTDDFIDMMNELKEKDIYNKNTYFLDNASIHHTKKFKNFAKENKIHVLYNAPYNSDKNPIEYIFSPLRKFIQKNPFKKIDELKVLINQYIDIDRELSINNTFIHAFGLFK